MSRYYVDDAMKEMRLAAATIINRFVETEGKDNDGERINLGFSCIDQFAAHSPDIRIPLFRVV